MTKADLDAWLKATAWDREYWSRVRDRALEINSDGCSGVPDWFVWTCYEHDVHYALHEMLSGLVIDFRTANYVLRVRIQQGSAFGRASPMSWWRWAGVKYLPAAKKAWETGPGRARAISGVL